MKTHFQSILSRFHRRDAGAVMTEFVIMLPIFVMLFVGIVELNRLQRAANKAHVMANKLMWETSVEVMTSPPNSMWADPHQVEEIAPEPPATCSSDRYHECAGFDWNKWKRLVDYGTFGEGLSAARFEEVQEWLDIAENRSRWLAGEEEIDLRMYDTVYNADSVWGEYALIATWDRAHSENSVVIPLGEPVGALGYFNNASLDGAPLVGGTPSMFAYGAGTRYGLIVANHVESVSTRFNSFDYEVEYQTLTPPRPMEMDNEEVFTVGTPRLLLQDTGFDRIPGFEYEFELTGFGLDLLEEGGT